jgi:hypothetical protein
MNLGLPDQLLGDVLSVVTLAAAVIIGAAWVASRMSPRLRGLGVHLAAALASTPRR